MGCNLCLLPFTVPNFNNHPTRCFVVTKINQNRTFQMNTYSNTSEGPSLHKRCNFFFLKSLKPHIKPAKSLKYHKQPSCCVLEVSIGFSSCLVVMSFCKASKQAFWSFGTKLDDVGLEKNFGNFEQCFQILILSKEITDCLKQFILIIFFLYFSQWCCETYQFQMSEWVPTIKTDRASS